MILESSESLRQALRTLNAYRMRSFLTVLSITIGVCSVILLTSLSQSAFATLVKGIEEVGGTRFVMLFPDSPKKAAKKASSYQGGLTRADAAALGGIPSIEKLTAFQSSSGVPVRKPGGSEGKTDLVKADEHFCGVFALPLSRGRLLTEKDIKERRRVALVGEDLAKKLYPGEEAVGKEVVVKGDRFRVVGRLNYAAKNGMHFGFSFSDVVVVPATSERERVGMIALISREKQSTTALLDRINAILLHRHRGVDDFQFIDLGGMLKGFYLVFYAMILVVGLIAGMSLLIGGVGIMNMMLVAVSERRREIGLRKAVGATEKAILTQFLVEAVCLSLFGALVGVILGAGLAQLATVIGPLINRGWVGIVSLPAILAAVLASAGIGIFFGWYPARQAAKLDPILCLRSEEA